MSKRVVKVSLTSASLDNAIRELEQYRKWLVERTKVFLEALAAEGMNIASARFAQATYDGDNDVTVSIEERGDNKYAVVATGKATLFIEFGTGIAYPDSHPEGAETGMVHGSWSESELGKGHWDDPNGWYYAHGKKSHGNPANMSMYNSIRELETKFEEIARKVFI